LGQTLRSRSPFAPTFVRNTSRSDQILRRSQMTHRANQHIRQKRLIDLKGAKKI
jgi:hypothetical protein